jgi:hypothetical protein
MRVCLFFRAVLGRQNGWDRTWSGIGITFWGSINLLLRIGEVIRVDRTGAGRRSAVVRVVWRGD